MEEKEQEKKEEQNLIDLGVLWHNFLPFLRRFWLLVLVFTVLCGAYKYVRLRRSFTPMYRSEAIFSVSVGSSTTTSDLYSNGYYYDNAAAKQAVSTFPYLLSSDVMRDLLLEELDASYINGSISASTISGTNFMVLTVTSTDAQDACDIARAVMEVYPQIGRKVIGDIQLVVSQEPSVAPEPYNSFVWHSSVARSAVLGLVLGLGVLVLLGASRRTILNSGDIKKRVNLPCLAHIPAVSVKQRKQNKSAGLLITRQDSASGFCESFRLLRLKLLRALDENDKVITFTSSVPSEGKSSVAANTALSLAKDGKQVLLIDGDLRSPSIKGLLGLSSPSEGLGEYLSDKSSKEGVDCLRFKDTNLVVLAGTKAFSNPAALLRSKKLEATIQRARGIFDYIIIDTPPCVMADASVFAALSDKVVYVVRRDFASRSQVLDSIRTFSDSGARICGFVLNCAKSGGSSTGYGYGYGYGYGKKKSGYGYGYGSSKSRSAEKE